MPRQEFQDYSFLCPLLELPYQVYFALVTAINRAKPGERKARFVDYVGRANSVRDIGGKYLTKYCWKRGDQTTILRCDNAREQEFPSLILFLGTESDWTSWEIWLAWNERDEFFSINEDRVPIRISSGEFFTLFHTLNAQ